MGRELRGMAEAGRADASRRATLLAAVMPLREPFRPPPCRPGIDAVAAALPNDAPLMPPPLPRAAPIECVPTPLGPTPGPGDPAAAEAAARATRFCARWGGTRS